jgi:hypothetical protein
LFIFLACFGAWNAQYNAAKPAPVQPIQVNIPPQPAPQVQITVPPPNIPPEMAYFGSGGPVIIARYALGQYIAINVLCRNFSQLVPAQKAVCWLKSFIIDTKPNSQNQLVVPVPIQDEMYKQFEKSLEKSRDTFTTTLGPSESHFGTTQPALLDEKLDTALRAGTKTILLTAEFDWQDGVGKHTNQLCEWLELGPEVSGVFAGPGMLMPGGNTVWNRCLHYNGLVPR